MIESTNVLVSAFSFLWEKWPWYISEIYKKISLGQIVGEELQSSTKYSRFSEIGRLVESLMANFIQLSNIITNRTRGQF